MTNTKKTILIVDDDKQFREYMLEMLVEQNYNVLGAANGEEGLSLYSSVKPDLIITDIVMPEKEGIELIITVRNVDLQTPIIAVSGGNLGNADSYLSMARKLGVNSALAKPFSLDAILQEIETLLSDK